MPVSKREIEELSANLRKLIDGQNIDIRDNREGALAKLRNDIHTLVARNNEEARALQAERDMLKDTLADISHQIKTPLTSMGIMADLLDGAPPNKQAELVANIRLSLDRTEWLVSALLKMARLDAAAVELKREHVSSGELVVRALEPLQIMLDAREQHIAIDGDVEISCDRRWTAEALSNIIKNASEHSPEGGSICLAAGFNPICAWISVTDSGSGIKHSELATLFRRFQGSRSDTGYGIGLPLALSIMRRQNGDIEVDGGGAGTDVGSGVEADTGNGAEKGAENGALCGATFTLKFYK